MKRKYILWVLATFFVGILIVSCRAKKVPITKLNHETEVLVPCSDQKSDADFFRGTGVGQSVDLSTAREKARMIANNELATSISAVTSRVAERYINDAGQKPSDHAETFESLTREKVNELISNVTIACNKTTQTTDGMYKVYMAVEVGKDEVFDGLDRKMAGDKKMNTLYDRDKFRKIYNQELQNYTKEYGK